MLKLLGEESFDVQKMAQIAGMDPRQIRYLLNETLGEYIQQTLAIQTKRGRRTLYPRAVLERILFIKLAQERLKEDGVELLLNREEWRTWMGNLTDEEVGRVIRREEPLQFGFERYDESGAYIETTEGERVESSSTRYGRQIPGYDKGAKPSGDEYSVIRVGRKAELRINGFLSSHQEEQLRLVCELIEKIIDGGQEHASTKPL